MDDRIARLEDQVRQLAGRLDAAEAYIAINNLQRAYGYYVDRGYWEDAARLFARDARLEINGRGVFIGWDRVREYLFRFGPNEHGKLFNHMQLQPVITIAPDGRTAKGRWRSLIQTGQFGAFARWGEGTYENAYVKEDGVWKIADLHFFQTFYSDYDGGWRESALPLVPQHADLPPDLPPSQDYKVYPEVVLVPFHYRNPVSGTATEAMPWHAEDAAATGAG